MVQGGNRCTKDHQLGALCRVVLGLDRVDQERDRPGEHELAEQVVGLLKVLMAAFQVDGHQRTLTVTGNRQGDGLSRPGCGPHHDIGVGLVQSSAQLGQSLLGRAGDEGFMLGVQGSEAHGLGQLLFVQEPSQQAS